MPLWTPKRERCTSNLWQVYSPKINRRLKLFSDMDYHHWILVEATPDIVAFCERPVEVLGLLDGKSSSSYINMWILWRNGTEEYRTLIRANKIEEIENRPKLKRQLDVQRSWCQRREVIYNIITDQEIYANKLLLHNWQQVLTHVTVTKDLELSVLQKTIRKVVVDEGSISLFSLNQRFQGVHPTAIMAAVFRLIHAGQLDAPLDQVELSETITLRPRHELSTQG
jgi:hypothetical protein